MKIPVKIGKKALTLEMKKGASINDALEQLSINRETVLVRKNGNVVVEEETLGQNDRIEIIIAVSGG